MPLRPPFFAQERSDTCALACLRTLLAQKGVIVSEADLVGAANFQAGGIDIEDLVALAERFGFRAEIAQLRFEEVSALLAREMYPIVLLDRYPFDGEFAVPWSAMEQTTYRWTMHAPAPAAARQGARGAQGAPSKARASEPGAATLLQSGGCPARWTQVSSIFPGGIP